MIDFYLLGLGGNQEKNKRFVGYAIIWWWVLIIICGWGWEVSFDVLLFLKPKGTQNALLRSFKQSDWGSFHQNWLNSRNYLDWY